MERAGEKITNSGFVVFRQNRTPFISHARKNLRRSPGWAKGLSFAPRFA